MCSAKPLHADAHNPKRRHRRRRLSHGVTSLMYAAQQGDVDRVRHIIRTQRLILFDQDRTGKTALHYCCTSDNIRAAQVADIITMAAPDLVESRDEDGFAPLHLAVISGNTQLVTFLLANGADVSAVDNEKHTVVHWATVCGETNALRAVLAAGAPVSTPDVHGGYPLHYAAQMCGGDKESQLGLQVLHTLLGHKDIDVSVQDGDKRQPLLWAASAGSAKAILALVRAGAVVEAADRDGLTALHCAASRGHTDCIDTLLTLCGASPDVIDSNGSTALHYAVTLGHADATALLLAHGADPNRQDRKGRSPAHCGCAKGQFETVKLIGARGANLWMRNARGDLPLQEAAASGRRELVSWLLSMRPSQVNARNNDGRTPLHMAALNDNADMCKILLDSGAAINPILRTSKNTFMTPLDCALQRGFRSTAKYLQLHGGVPASRLSAQHLNTQVSSSLSLQIRDDVTFWGGSSSNSEDEEAKVKRGTKKVHRKKANLKDRRKKSESETDEVEREKLKSEKSVGRSAKRTTKNTATNTFESALDESPRKAASSRIDYSNEIIINGKTEINIHQTKEITVDSADTNQVSPRKVQIDSSETITLPGTEEKEKRSKSAKISKVAKESSEKKEGISRPSTSTIKTEETPEFVKPGSLLGHSTGTSDDTMDTVIDTYKQRAESVKAELRQSSRERMIELPEISNTSEEADVPQELVVEASIHPEPKNIEANELDKQGDDTNIKDEDVAREILKFHEQDLHSEIFKKEEHEDRIEVIEKENKAGLLQEMVPPIELEVRESELESSRKEVSESNGLLDKLDVPADKNEIELREINLDDNADTFEITEVKEIVETTDRDSKLGTVEQNVETDKNDQEETVKPEKDSTSKDVEVQAIKDTKDSLTKAAIVKIDQEIEKEKKLEDQSNLAEIKNDVEVTAEKEKVVIEEATRKEQKLKDDVSDASLQEEGDKKAPVSKVVGKPREKRKVPKEKDDSKLAVAKQKADDEQKSKTRSRKRASERPGVLKVLKSDEKESVDIDSKEDHISADDIYSSSSEYPSDSLEQTARQEHKSFKILSEKEALELEATKRKRKHDRKTKDDEKNIRSRSDERRRTKEAEKKVKKTKIPTPTFHTPLSKSDRQLDRLVDHERRTQFDMDARVPSLPNIHESNRDRFLRDQQRPESNLSAPILPSVYSDNERGSGSDLDESRLSPTKKKKVKKRSKIRRRESKSAGSDYESSNLIDSGFEPSPRSSRIPKWKNMSDRGVNMTSVTRTIQSNIRRYHLERKIFQHLLDLKRNQIRAGQHNEAVLVKRAIDQYNQSCASTVGAGRYIPEDYSFKSFESFLYESLRKLQKMDAAYLKGLPERSEHANPLFCTQSTHRCMHATHAYTGVPCAAYLPKMDHHTIPKIGFGNTSACKPGTAGFLPNINQKKAVTLELSHGADKQVISLPTDKLDQNKRYYVTFTVKGHEEASSEENGNGHIHSKSE